MLPKYYLNDYFTLIDSPILKEREFMKTDIREEKRIHNGNRFTRINQR